VAPRPSREDSPTIGTLCRGSLELFTDEGRETTEWRVATQFGSCLTQLGDDHGDGPRLGGSPDPRGEFTEVRWQGTGSVEQPGHQRPHGRAAQFFGREVFGGVQRKVAPAEITETVPRAGGVQGKPTLPFGGGQAADLDVAGVVERGSGIAEGGADADLVDGHVGGAERRVVRGCPTQAAGSLFGFADQLQRPAPVVMLGSGVGGGAQRRPIGAQQGGAGAAGVGAQAERRIGQQRDGGAVVTVQFRAQIDQVQPLLTGLPRQTAATQAGRGPRRGVHTRSPGENG
jgi:hypothetical protein